MTMIDDARAAVRTGQRSTAAQILSRVVQREPGNGEAWFLLAEVVDDFQQQTYCLGMATRLGYTPAPVAVYSSPPEPATPILPAHPAVLRKIELEMPGAAESPSLAPFNRAQPYYQQVIVERQAFVAPPVRQQESAIDWVQRLVTLLLSIVALGIFVLVLLFLAGLYFDGRPLLPLGSRF
jgi:hypothetical protein